MDLLQGNLIIKPTIMKRLIISFLVIFLSLSIIGQNKTLVLEKGIKTTKIFVQELSEGFNNKFIAKETTYNESGEIIEIIELNRKGKIKRLEKFNFDNNGNCIEELYYESSGKIKKRVVTEYVNNLKTTKEYYDSEGRLYRKKTYEYEFE